MILDVYFEDLRCFIGIIRPMWTCRDYRLGPTTASNRLVKLICNEMFDMTGSILLNKTWTN